MIIVFNKCTLDWREIPDTGKLVNMFPSWTLCQIDRALDAGKEWENEFYIIKKKKVVA